MFMLAEGWHSYNVSNNHDLFRLLVHVAVVGFCFSVAWWVRGDQIEGTV